MSHNKQAREILILRVLWMVLFALVWQLAELVLLGVVLLQLVLRLINGAPSRALMEFGDSLSQYLAQIGRFASFHSDEKPWPFADWPAAREPQVEAPFAAAPAPASAPVPAAAVVAPVAIAATDEAAAAEGAQDSAAAAAPQTPAAAAATEASDAPPKAPDGGDAEPRA